jgi:hypothetical protein
MPVDDRLRRGLESNARAFVPEGEWRLAQVHRRHRKRIGILATPAALVVIATAGIVGHLLWGSGPSRAPEPAQSPSQATTSTAVSPGTRIPDSGWRKVVTEEQLVRAGADRQFLAENVRPSGRLPTILSFIGTVYSQSGRFPVAWTVGDAGTVSYDPDGRLVLTSTSPECRGCVATLSWEIVGDRLRLSDFQGTPVDPIAEVMLEGVWTRVES